MTTTDGRSKLRRGGRELIIPTQALALRFRIELQETDPLVWREIEVPGDYSFWDLHVAIQDAMGWQDYHLHRFTVPHPRTRSHVREPARGPLDDGKFTDTHHWLSWFIRSTIFSTRRARTSRCCDSSTPARGRKAAVAAPRRQTAWYGL